MRGGGNHRANGERSAEKSMDDYLKSVGLHRNRIAKDGSCLFRAVAEQVLLSQSQHARVRAQCVEFLRQHRDNYEAFIEGDFDDYLCKLQDPKQWVGEVEINALSVMYKRDFLIFQEPGKPAVNITGNKFNKEVWLCFLNGNHYDSVYEIQHMKSAALCQSMLYELLYEKVFSVDRGTLTSSLRTNRPSYNISDDNMAPCVSSDDSDPEVKEAPKGEKDTLTTAARHSSQSWQRGRGRGRHLPGRVRRSLNPNLFRNVEYDVWQTSLKAQQKRDYCIAAGMQYSVGDHCQADVEGRYCNATIKEIHADVGQVTVETESLEQLLQSSGTQSTSTKVTREKKPANGHDGEWEERRRGRGRGRGGTASSATAPGSVGRTMKQHSWPAQTTAEDRGGQRVARSSCSEAEPASFGLSEVQRLAKEEAEKNVALVELHLRDENSFPALTSNGVKHPGDRKQLQRKDVKSPVENLKAPSAGEGQKSSIDRPASSLTQDEKPPGWCDSIKVPTPNMAAGTTPSKLHSVGAASVKDPNTKAVSPSSLRPASLPSPTFIAPIAPNPAVALDFHRSSSHPRSPLPHSPSPPALTSPSTDCVPSKVLRPTSASPQITSSLNTEGVVESPAGSHPSPPLETQTVTHNSLVQPDKPQVQASVMQVQHEGKVEQQLQNQSLTSPNQNQPPTVQIQTQILTDVEPVDTHDRPHEPQSEVAPVLEHQNQTVETQTQPSFHQPQSPDPPYQPQMQTATNSFHPDVQHYLQDLEAQTKPGGQAFDPSLPYQSQTAQVQVDDTAQQQQPPSSSTSAAPPLLPPLLGTQPYPQIPSGLPLHPGGVSLQQLSQLYQDPLYPGFPLEPNGSCAQTPSYSSMKSGEDLPRDVNILRFFFNLGVKAFSNPMCQPYVYLLPLHQASNLQHNLTSSTGNFMHAIPPAEHQAAYQQHQFSSGPQYNAILHQSLPAEASNPSESAKYPVIQPAASVQGSLLPWQPPHPKRQLSPSYPGGYTPQSQYQAPSSQVYQRGGHTLYSPTVQTYTPPSHHYPNTPGEPWGAAEQSRHINGATIPGPRLSPASCPLEHSAAAFHSVDSRALKNEHSEMRGLPQFEHHHKPPPVPYHDVTMPRSSNAASSPVHYYFTDKGVTNDNNFPRQPTKTHNHLKSHQTGSGSNHLGVGCSTELHPEGIKAMTWSNQTAKRGSRSRGGRRTRPEYIRGEGGSGYNQFNSSYVGRGRDY